MRPDRTPYDRWRRSPVPPEKRADKLGTDQMAMMLRALPFSKRISALNGLVLRARTLPELHVKVRAAIKHAKKNGLLPAMTTDQKAFKLLRDAAQRRTSAKKATKQSKPSKPKHQPEIGTPYGDWVTISESYFPDKTYPGGTRIPTVRCRCTLCDTETPVILGSLLKGRSKSCRPCSAKKLRVREAEQKAGQAIEYAGESFSMGAAK